MPCNHALCDNESMILLAIFYLIMNTACLTIQYAYACTLHYCEISYLPAYI